MSVVVHDDCVGIGWSSKQFPIDNVMTSLGQGCPEDVKERALGDVVVGKVGIEYPFSPQKRHMTNLVHSCDQLIQHQGLSLRSEKQIPHFLIIHQNIFQQRLTDTSVQMLLNLIDALVDYPMHVGGTSQRISILDHAHLGLFHLLHLKTTFSSKGINSNIDAA